jgi:hypothetical protein
MDRRKKKTYEQMLIDMIHTWLIGCPLKRTSNKVETATATTAMRIINTMGHSVLPPPARGVGRFSSLPAVHLTEAQEASMGMGALVARAAATAETAAEKATSAAACLSLISFCGSF